MDVNDDLLPSWRPSTSKESVLEFVAAVTDAASESFVPPVDRVAVFDNDGTLWAEMPLYAQLAFALDRAGELGHPVSLEELQAGGLGAVLDLVKLTHSGITTEEFDAACRQWIETARHPRFATSYLATAYQPMLELLALLKEREFSCWIFSGGGADFMRAFSTELYGLPPHRVIGSIGSTEFRDGDNGPELVKGPDLQILNDGAQKPVSIHQHVGQRPILAAGNTDGDLPMLSWTAAGPHRSLQLAIKHTDAEREYAYDTDPLLGSGNAALLAAAGAPGWSVVDMAADWATVFPPPA
jgi:haloacid dehalogenase-like hydrolase